MVVVDGKTCKVAVFVCTNERPPDRVCCKKAGGMDFYLKLKEKVKAMNLQGTHWISRSGCLGFCSSEGTTIAIFKPQKAPQWFNQVKLEELDSIWREIES